MDLQPLVKSGWWRVSIFLVLIHVVWLGRLRGQEQVSTSFPAARLQVVGDFPFQVLDGWELTKVSTPEITTWPIVAEWDVDGSLLVLESAGVSGGIMDHGETRPHRLVRLRDRNGDGVFDDRRVVAKDLPFPEGVLPLGDKILVGAPPKIWMLEDLDKDGEYETRSVWFDGGTLTRCANDLHGPYLGRDGWIYWCKGAFAEQRHEIDGIEMVSTAAHLFRRRFEGGPIEVVMSGGMDNPIEFVMLPNGEKFFTSTFLQNPADGKRDGVAHAVFGGVFGKVHDVLDGLTRTGPLMPITIHLGPAAPSGLLQVETVGLPSLGCKDSQIAHLAVAEFNFHRLSIHALTERGSSYESEAKTLFQTDRIDFHPTDVLQDGDGSLIVVDTGGWYDLCCPSSAVDQKVALGGIYRLRDSRSVGDAKGSIGGPASEWPSRRWSELDSQSLAEAMAWMGDAQRSEKERLRALWMVSRSSATEARMAIVRQLASERASLRQAAAHAIGVQRWDESRALEAALVSESNLQAARGMVEALGRVGRAESIVVLRSRLMDGESDAHLHHSLLYALIELQRREPGNGILANWLLESAWQERGGAEAYRAAVWVLDQTRGPGLKASHVWRLWDSAEGKDQTLAAGVFASHPEWASQEMLEWDSRWRGTPKGQRDRLRALFASWSQREEARSWLAGRLHEVTRAEWGEQLDVVSLLKEMKFGELPEGWAMPIGLWLEAVGKRGDLGSLEWYEAFAEWCRSLRLRSDRDGPLLDRLRGEVVANPSVAIRGRLLACLPTDSTLEESTQNWLVDTIVADFTEVEERAKTREDMRWIWLGLDRVRLGGPQVARLEAIWESVTPDQFGTLVSCMQRTEDEAVQKRMLQSLAKYPMSKTLPSGRLVQIFRQASPGVQALAIQVDRTLGQASAASVGRLDAIEKDLPPGDVAAGFQIFRNPKYMCSACHRVGYVGGLVGPELSKIGGTRTRRDLLESILFPSARLAASYIPSKIVTVDGEVINGLVVRETSEAIEVVHAADRTTRILKQDIESRAISDVSVMPAGLDATMSMQELADLIAFLESKR